MMNDYMGYIAKLVNLIEDAVKDPPRKVNPRDTSMDNEDGSLLRRDRFNNSTHFSARFVFMKGYVVQAGLLECGCD